MARFTLPRDLYFGDNSMEELKVLKGHKKAFVVTGGSSMKKNGFLQKLENVLKDAGLEVMLFEGVEPDPSVETVFRGAEAMRKFEPDVIVAIGGGSPIDAAKAMWVFYEHPEKTFDDIKDPFTMPKLRQKAIFVAVPSTSGTATEVTAFSVITDYSTKVKYPLADFEITPDIAVLDGTIAQTMPKTLTAHTGMDAMTHAIEAYVASARSDFSDPLALKAISMIYENLVDSYNGDKEARGKMHIAQCLAGMAFSNALLGIVHSLAHKVGAQYEVPHGCCNAIMLPFVIQFNSKVCMNRFADIARTMGLPGATDKQLTNSLVAAIRELNRKVGIAASYKEHGVPEELFKSTLDFVCENAVKDPCTGANPRACTVEDLKKVLTCSYYGEDVTF
ncbi:MAG TPA: iron-containing alcohol dehydrogenase [Candidatus Ventrousia excrementavium]|uniref:Iron-containing alcohol dehydrogenase n=1 Tax=Candidatus Ventrousia excrementavium TaxID=2840961 RepID=A0A9D1IV13_9CLOT|nr:iron-containing alcohol dehydrogenase [Candidatus Ventrousia excrementavium]